MYSHAGGYNSIAKGNCSHAEGGAYYVNSSEKTQKLNGGIAEGHGSHAEGTGTVSSGIGSHAEGSGTEAIGNYSHAEGLNTISEGSYSHAEGGGTKAVGKYSHSSGYNTVADIDNSFACGQYNNSQEDTLFSIGIGTKNARKNAFEVKKNGDIYILIDGVPTKLQDLLKKVTY